jgi:1-deoxy-D-xylulose-5-phosphate reductoisomerase
VFNAANEQAVAAFLSGNLPFPGIVETVRRVLDEHLGTAESTTGGPGAGAGSAVPENFAPTDSSVGLQNKLSLSDVLTTESWARARADELLEGVR